MRLLATVLLLLAACGSPGIESSPDRADYVELAREAPAAEPSLAQRSPAERAPDAALRLPTDTAAATGTTVVPSMLIRTGQARLEVQRLEEGIARVRALAQRLGGYVGSTSLSAGRDEVRSATLEVKLPAARFDEALTGLDPIGRVESINATAQDVGEEYVDLQARRTNAARLEQRLLDLLASRTGRLEDVLNVERELARVREEIERYDGRLRYLRTRAAASTLTVHLHEPARLLDTGPGSNPLVRAVRRAWRNFVGFVAGFIEVLGVLIPLGALLAGAWWVGRRLWRGRPPRP